MKLRNPLANALHHGSSGDAVGHWWAQRLSAMLLLVLIGWALYALTVLVGSDYESARAWLGQPVNAALAVLFIVSALYHASLGLQVVIEDYVHHRPTEVIALVAIKLGAVIAGALVVFAIFNIAMGS